MEWPGRVTNKPWMGLARMGGIGDNLIAAAVLPALAEKYRVDVLTNTNFGCLFENNPYVSKLTQIPDDDIPKDSMPSWQGWFAKRAHEYEYFVNLSHSCETLVALPQSQTGFYWPEKWRRQRCGKNYLDAIAEIVDVEPEFSKPLFYPTDEEREKAIETKAKVGERVIGWCTAGSRLDKYHPLTPIIIGRLIRELGMPVIMFGASEREKDVVKATMEHVEKANGSIAGVHEARNCVDADGKTPTAEWPIRRSITQLMSCDLVIGPDTGLMWGAAFEAVPKIVLLSHASPENIVKHWKNTFAPAIDTEKAPCWPCHRLHDDITHCRPNKDHNGAACISSISAETIISEAARLLAHEPEVKQAKGNGIDHSEAANVFKNDWTPATRELRTPVA